MDKYGLFGARVATAIPMTTGLIMMIFVGNRLIFEIGTYFIAVAAIGVLITNLTVQPIWPRRTSTIGSIYSGTFDGSAATFMLIKVAYQNFGWSLQTCSIILASLSSIIWIRSFFLMPAKAIPRELPENYDVSKETLVARCFTDGTVDELDRKELQSRSNRDDDIPDDKAKIEDEVVQSKQPSIMTQFRKEICSVQFVSLCVWYCLVSLRINSFQAWFNNSLQWWFPNAEHVHSELTNIFGLTYIMSLPISPAAGVVVDGFANHYRLVSALLFSHVLF